MQDPAANGEAPSSAPRIHRADPLERKRTFWILLIVLALGVLMMLLLQRELAAIRGWLNAGETEFATARFLILVRAALGLLALVGVVVGALVGHGAFLVLRERRYPHSRARLVRDREILEGDRAVLMGRLGLVLAVAFIIVSVVGAAYGWIKLATF